MLFFFNKAHPHYPSCIKILFFIRWVLFPDYLPKSVVKGKEFLKNVPDDEPLSYFYHILPLIKSKEKMHLQSLEFIQYPGDTVFVPGGWWHAVINLDNTIALTQNFLTPNNFTGVWRSLRKERRKLAGKLLKKLKSKFPVLYEQARKMNEKDGFVMDKENVEIKKEYELQMSSDTGSSSDSSSDSSSNEESESGSSSRGSAR